jgi:hypothetical protein
MPKVQAVLDHLALKIMPYVPSKRNNYNPFQSNFSATRILPSSYLFWAGKRLVGYL